MASYILLICAALCVAIVASQKYEDIPSKLSYEIYESDSDESAESDESDESEEQILSLDQQTRNDANEIADEFVEAMNKLIFKLGRDPIELPDDINRFEWKVLLITYSGELSYTKGWLQGLSSTIRRSSASMKNVGEDKIVSMPLRYSVLQYSYDYVSKFMGLGPKGQIDGRITNTNIGIDIRIDPQNHISLEKFTFKKLGKTKIKFTGNGLTDWMANIFTAVTMPFLKPIVYNTLYSTVEESIHEVIEELNKEILS